MRGKDFKGSKLMQENFGFYYLSTALAVSVVGLTFIIIGRLASWWRVRLEDQIELTKKSHILKQ